MAFLKMFVQNGSNYLITDIDAEDNINSSHEYNTLAEVATILFCRHAHTYLNVGTPEW